MVQIVSEKRARAGALFASGGLRVSDKSSAVNISVTMKSSDSAPAAVPEANCDPLPTAGRGPDAMQPLRSIQWAQALVLAALYSFLAFLCLHIADAGDPDVWWHLRTGEWILHMGRCRIPIRFPCSARESPGSLIAGSSNCSSSTLPLAGPGWPGGLHRWMVVSIAVVLHRLIRRLQADFLSRCCLPSLLPSVSIGLYAAPMAVLDSVFCLGT